MSQYQVSVKYLLIFLNELLAIEYGITNSTTNGLEGFESYKPECSFSFKFSYSQYII